MAKRKYRKKYLLLCGKCGYGKSSIITTLVKHNGFYPQILDMEKLEKKESIRNILKNIIFSSDVCKMFQTNSKKFIIIVDNITHNIKESYLAEIVNFLKVLKKKNIKTVPFIFLSITSRKNKEIERLKNLTSLEITEYTKKDKINIINNILFKEGKTINNDIKRISNKYNDIRV